MFKTKEAWLNFIYSFGAAIVIIGALFKITHFAIGPLTGNLTLSIGLITEALIFIVFAFDPPRAEESYAWENVYPELLDKHATPNPLHSNMSSKKGLMGGQMAELETSLSEKLDRMLQDAKIDANLFERLKGGIDNLATSVDQINQTVDISGSTNRYNDQLNKAATHMESMNALYAVQMEATQKQADFTNQYVSDMQKSVEHSNKFNEELQGLTSNLNSLNRVYGGMLTAMKS
jgi:gliding motility-associated protein GldL